MRILVTEEAEISKRGTGLLNRSGSYIARQWMQCGSGICGRIHIILLRAVALKGSELGQSRLAGSIANAPPEQGKKRLIGLEKERAMNKSERDGTVGVSSPQLETVFCCMRD